jgi:magnesium-protoporphyrin IX monomethyl ester (oxidative) cyclase
MSNKLILVYPPKLSNTSGYTGDVSLALLYLAGAARDSGLCDNITIFDFNAPVGGGKEISDLFKAINSYTENTFEGHLVVAINCLYSALFPTVRQIAKEIKEKFPEVKIAVGGMHPTLFAREIIENCSEIDAVGIGEFDLDFPKLLKFFYEQGNTDDIEGVCLRVKGETIFKPRLCYIQDLDALPRPGYEFYDFQEYAVDTANWWSPDGFAISPFQLPLLTSRSCPNRCNFCAMRLVMGDRFRARSAENVFEEIQYLYNEYGVNYFKILDDNVTLNRNRTVQICKKIIESGLKVYLDTPGGISLKTLDEEMVEMMRRAGFIIISLAVESGSEHIRNEVMGKHLEREQIIKAFRMCRQAGMQVKAFFVIGMPEETEETFKQTVELLQKLDVTNVTLTPAKPLPGTRLFEQCVRDGLLIGGFDVDTLWTGEAEQNSAMKEEFYIKRLLNHSERQFWIKPYKLSLDRLVEMDLELQQIAYEKSKEWVERVRRNNG